MKRIFSLICILCMLALPVGCKENPASDGSAADTQTEVPSILLAGEGAPAYVIVRSDNPAKGETEAALMVRKYLEKCGVATKITTDWEKNPVSEYEIVIGDTLRAASDAGITLKPTDVGEEGYFIKVSAARIYICGGTPAATLQAAEYFLTEFFGYRGDPDTASPALSVSVPADYEYIVRQSYALSEIRVAGRNLSEFRIVCEDTASSKAAASQIQSYFYSLAGIYMEIHDANTGSSPALIVSGSDAKGEGTMSIRCENGNLHIHTEPYEAFSRGFTRFTDGYFDGASGEVALAADFSFTTDLMDAVSYLEFGAVGDGVHDDLAAIRAAHAFANRYDLPVKADAGKTFLIGASTSPVLIGTDTDFTDAVIRIDDRELTDSQHGKAVFSVEPSAATVRLSALKSVSRGQTNLGVTPAEDSLVILTDSSVKRWIRKGVDANDGSDQQEVILVRKDGTVDPSTPILWDYANLTAQAIPLEEKTLTIRGGTFITVAREDIPTFSYYSRGFRITRSNTVVEGMTHLIENEGKNGSPYYGFWQIADCADVRLKDCTFDIPRTFYYTSDGTHRSAGTYGITITRTTGVRLENCRQTTDILSAAHSAALGSNHCKNLIVDSCRFSNCDIGHTGAYNTTIRNTTVGRTPVSAIGGGTLLIENCTFYAHAIVNLRPDYGAHWDGDIILRNCTWTPHMGDTLTKETYSIFTGSNEENHDFGYACTLPHTVTIENLRVEDGNSTASYRGISIFADINPARTNTAAENAAKYPLRVTQSVTVDGFSSASAKGWFISPNGFMFRDTVLRSSD